MFLLQPAICSSKVASTYNLFTQTRTAFNNAVVFSFSNFPHPGYKFAKNTYKNLLKTLRGWNFTVAKPKASTKQVFSSPSVFINSV